MEEIKAAHRKLMRKYHPDRHVGSPQKQKAANELSMRVNEAYAALEKYLAGED
jgi:curved DNA-binding protein CbpA